MHKVKSSQSNFYRDKVNSKSATRLFYQPFSYFFCWNFGIKLLVLYCRECHNKLALSLPKFFLQLVFKIHFKTFTKILHSQWFIDILGMSICPLRTADQLERTQDLATKVIIFWLENGKFEFSRKQYIFLKHSKREFCAEFYYHF